MAKRTKSMFSGSARKRYESKKHEEVQLPTGGGNLPAGIENGVARLLSLELQPPRKEDTDSLPWISIRGMVETPPEHDGVPVRGMQDFFNLPGGRPKSEDEVVDRILGVLNTFGYDMDDCDWSEVEDNSVFQSIVESKVYFRFRTWQGQPTNDRPDPRVNRIFLAAAPGYESDGEEDEEPEDDTEEAEENEEQEEEEDLATLAKRADEEDDEDAQEAIEKAALDAGIDKTTIEEADDYATIVGMIDSDETEDGDEQEEEESEEGAAPEKGEVWKYKPPRSRRLTEVEVITVNNTKQTCNVKRLEDGKVFKAASWGELKEVD